MKKKRILLLCLVSCLVLSSCAGTAAGKVALGERELSQFDYIDGGEAKTVTYLFSGTLPSKKSGKGIFFGSILITESDGTPHRYGNLKYLWHDGFLFLYRGDPGEAEGGGFVCRLDPENPDDIFIADRDWNEAFIQQRIVAFVEKGITAKEERELDQAVRGLKNAERVVYRSAGEVLDELLGSYGEYQDILQMYGDDNPVHAEYEIYVKTKNLWKVLDEVRNLKWIEKASSHGEVLPEKIGLITSERDEDEARKIFDQLLLIFTER